MKRLFFFFAFANGINLVSAQTGNVGIGTTLPKARLHVADSSVLFDAANDIPGGINNIMPPVSGPGRRMMWFPARAAFRTGYVDGSQWDRDSIGEYSFAAGNNVKAMFTGSIAVGVNTVANGFGAFAAGYNSSALSSYSAAIGSSAVAAVVNSYAFGLNVGALGSYSMALGYASNTNSEASYVFGESNETNAPYSMAIGRLNRTYSENSIALGSIATTYGKYAIAAGYGVNANGFGSFVTGIYNDTVVSREITSVNPSTPLFIIGNGVNHTSRANAMVVRYDGKTGLSVKVPSVLLHQDEGNAIATYHKFSAGTTTGQTSTDGFDIGITADGNAEIKQRENKHLFLFTNNTSRVKVDSSGRTGIGTSYPLARLHVADSSVLFSAVDLPPVTPGNPPQSGEGRRMMWYADKAAFRTGYVINNYWNKDSIGNYSIAAGFNLKARGIAAAAFNYQSEALGDYSTALGNSIARGTQSVAAGFITNANGAYSSSFGTQTYANGYSSFVVGQYNDSAVTRQPNAISQTQQTPLFIVGNGTDAANRNNAMVVNVNGNTGLNTSVPETNMDINGDLAYRQNVITLVNGLNSNIDVGKYSFVKITGPNINFSIDGIQGGVDGKILTLFNTTGSNMLIVDQTGSSSNAANRINTLEGGVSISTINNGSVTLQYSSADNRWMVIGMKL